MKFSQFSEGTLSETFKQVVNWGIGLVDRLDPVLNLLGRGFQTATNWISGLISFVKENWSFLAPVTAGILAAVVALKAWTIAQAVLNAVMSANPIGLLVVAIGALVGAFIWAYNYSEKFRMVLGGLWEPFS